MGGFLLAPFIFLLTQTCCISRIFSHSSLLTYKDPSQPVEARVTDLLARMTLEEKIGQMIQIERSIANATYIRTRYIGSVLSGGGSVPKPQATPSMWAQMVDSFQKGALSTRLGIPIIYGIDAVHGNGNVYGATIFPHNIALGCTRDPDLARRIGVATALEVRGTGIQYTFAPCIAVCRDPRWGRCYESYSEDPQLVGNMTEIIIGLQGQPSKPAYPFVGGQQHVIATAKHFVGDGGTIEGLDENNTISSYKRFVSTHMVPYFDAINKGVASVMVSYSSWNGKKMHANQKLITHVLKKQLGFQGFVISDWEGIDRITSPPGANYSDSMKIAINAGIDMVMVPFEIEHFFGNLRAQVNSKIVPIKRINDAVRRILRVKFVAGLFENPMSNNTLFGMVGAEIHRELAREAVRKSLVLLKNGKSVHDPLLPLDKNAAKILVAGSHANDLGYQCGGWTITWQGLSGNITIGTTFLDAVKSTVSKSTTIVYEENPDQSFVHDGNFDYAIVVVGEKPYAEFYGDSNNLTISLDGTDTIQNICSFVKCLVILISGRPLVIEPYLPLMEALVAAWLPGSEGEGITDVIFGDFDFQGKLSRTWFRRVDQLPMNIGDQHYDPLFPYGFGLTMGVGWTCCCARCTLQLAFFLFVILL